jgi:hypothetical protein
VVESISIRTERERRGRGGSSDFKSNWTRIEMAGRSAGPLVAGCRCLIVSHRPRRHQSARFSFSLSLLLLPFDLLKPHPSPSFARSTARREGRRTTKRRPQGVKLKLETHPSRARELLQVAWQRKSFFFLTCPMIHLAIYRAWIRRPATWNATFPLFELKLHIRVS